jgi:uncharacterized protein YdeI (YjbR/CyaY-like superfamily)
MDVKFFSTLADLRRWFEINHDKLDEQWVGFYKKATGKASITWPEAVDAALCFGWIDGLRKSIDETSYTNRFTPRRAKSNWSAINIKRAKELSDLGLMHPSGLAAFEKRDEPLSQRYSLERKSAELTGAYAEVFQQNKNAWEFFQSQPPSYQKNAAWWILSARQEATREKRLSILIRESEGGERIGPLKPPK